MNAVAPGWIDTTGERQFTEADDMRMMARHLPFGIGRPEHVAKGVTALHTSTLPSSLGLCKPADRLAHQVTFLASSDADYITGTTLTIDGGFSVAQRIPQLHEPIVCAREPICPVED